MHRADEPAALGVPHRFHPKLLYEPEVEHRSSIAFVECAVGILPARLWRRG